MRKGELLFAAKARRRGEKLLDAQFEELTAAIIGAAIEVHRNLGRGLLESTYEECLEWELRQLSYAVARQMTVPIVYKGRTLKWNYRVDLLVDDKVIVDVKAVDRLADIHHAQVLT
ncbi:MAG: GxxExxY protein [Gemmatimonadaceae bacterium]